MSLHVTRARDHRCRTERVDLRCDLTEAEVFHGATTGLAAPTAAELTCLDRVAERKLWEIDRAGIHAVTGGSDDGFLYARGFIVAMGREFYDAVCDNPQMAVPSAECEDICYFFAHIHRERFGDYPETGSGISREPGHDPSRVRARPSIQRTERDSTRCHQPAHHRERPQAARVRQPRMRSAVPGHQPPRPPPLDRRSQVRGRHRHSVTDRLSVRGR